MMILDVLKDSLTYSLKDFNVIIKLGLLVLLSFLIIPFFFIQGYSYNITSISVNSVIGANYRIPLFENWKNIFINGIKQTLVILIYSIPAIIISCWALSNIDTISFIVSVEYLYVSIGIELTAIGLFWIATFIIIMVAIPHMTKHRSLKVAFDIKEIIKIIKTVGVLQYFYFVIWWIIIASGMTFTSFIGVEIFVSILNFIYFIIFSHIINLSFMNMYFDFYLFTLVLILIVYPILLMFGSRAIASIYNMG